MRPSLLLSLLCCLAPAVTGYPRFADQLPNGRNVTHPCRSGEVWDGVGHYSAAGGGAPNVFGLDFLQAGQLWTQALCQGDSDGDGRTNGEELGDPNCLWSPGDTPSVTYGITHPGVCEPVDSPQCQARPVPAVQFPSQREWMEDECQRSRGFDCPALEQTENLQHVDLRVPYSQVPPQKTTIVCIIYEFPDISKDYHVIAQETLVNNSNVIHHMSLFNCEDDIPVQGPHDCTERNVLCPYFVIGWGFGISNKCLFEEAGIRFGKTGLKRFLVEYHWNNPEEADHHWDNSGLRLYYTDHLRPSDMLVMTLGPQWLAIPPGSTDAIATSECTDTCTSNLMDGDITITNVYDHMHLTGRRMTVELWRKGQFVQTISDGKNYRYDTPTEHELAVPVVVKPGDSLRTTCHFASPHHNHTIHYGRNTYDEMCISFVVFYPGQNMPRRQRCMTWRNLSIDGCDPGPYGGCDYNHYSDINHFANASFYTAVMEYCDPFGYCKEECKATLRDARRQEPCLRGEPWEMLRLVVLRNHPKGTAFLAAMESCEAEVAVEDERALLHTPDPTPTTGPVDSGVTSTGHDQHTHQSTGQSGSGQPSGGDTGAMQQAGNSAVTARQHLALLWLLAAGVTALLARPATSS